MHRMVPAEARPKPSPTGALIPGGTTRRYCGAGGDSFTTGRSAARRDRKNRRCSNLGGGAETVPATTHPSPAPNRSRRRTVATEVIHEVGSIRIKLVRETGQAYIPAPGPQGWKPITPDLLGAYGFAVSGGELVDRRKQTSISHALATSGPSGP